MLEIFTYRQGKPTPLDAMLITYSRPDEPNSFITILWKYAHFCSKYTLLRIFERHDSIVFVLGAVQSYRWEPYLWMTLKISKILINYPSEHFQWYRCLYSISTDKEMRVSKIPSTGIVYIKFWIFEHVTFVHICEMRPYLYKRPRKNLNHLDFCWGTHGWGSQGKPRLDRKIS